MASQVYFDDVQVGAPLPLLEKPVTTQQLQAARFGPAPSDVTAT